MQSYILSEYSSFQLFNAIRIFREDAIRIFWVDEIQIKKLVLHALLMVSNSNLALAIVVPCLIGGFRVVWEESTSQDLGNNLAG
jgi:hypothetical protein